MIAGKGKGKEYVEQEEQGLGFRVEREERRGVEIKIEMVHGASDVLRREAPTILAFISLDTIIIIYSAIKKLISIENFFVAHLTVTLGQILCSHSYFFRRRIYKAGKSTRSSASSSPQTPTTKAQRQKSTDISIIPEIRNVSTCESKYQKFDRR
ncbi:uncharacterized protein LAJ45_07836 [Morchella importuna]|uniref:uncharacterized protein n=1 Tax=Morchella importuna TaxID=1174673 RepID=UPI001E8CF746|nr:uncharacterized protein LAJ45_07836 [Morchella importuna]KAH8148072.1 hypothetical protein LAJ45_07836 [Morchella importuna]